MSIITDTSPSISIVICAYTEERWLDLVAAIESIQQQTMPPSEIIVVIDHNMSLFERARTHLIGVTVIQNGEPKGLSGARNSGVALSQGRLIAFLDDDAIADPRWLEQLARCCQNPQVLGAGGIVEPLWSSKRPRWFPDEFYWVVGCTYQNLSGRAVVVRNPFGGCVCIRREVFEAVGGFRNGIGRVGNLPLGGEETELCIRAAQRWPCKLFLCEPQARIRHHIPPSRARWSYFVARCYAEGISKSLITEYVGAKNSLASERAYTLLTLPKGVARCLAEGFFRLDLTGFLRAGAIVTGLAITTMGYLVGSISRRVVAHKNMRQKYYCRG
jgi:GT2 family glycosyltransferase